MTCRSDLCTQGRNPCPTPWHCGHGLRRIEPAALEQRDGGMSIEFAGEEPSTWSAWRKDVGINKWSVGLFLFVAAFAIAAVLHAKWPALVAAMAQLADRSIPRP